MTIFKYQSYKEFVRDRVASLPSGGRGEYQRIARTLKMHSSLVSQVFRGSRDLTFDQACNLCVYWELSELETQYFLMLVGHSRCGTDRARKVVAKQLERIRRQVDQVQERVSAQQVLSEEVQAIFYSSWIYSAVRNATALPECGSVDEIARHLRVPKMKVRAALTFLLDAGLCVEVEGRVTAGPRSTHIPAESQLVTRHHANWRLKGIHAMEQIDLERELFFTAPMTLSKEDVIWVRQELLELVSKLAKRVEKSPSEELACLNFDWFLV